MTKTKLLAALMQGLAVLITGLLIYDKPPDLAALWQPALQGALAVLSALGVGAAVRRVA